MEEYIRLEEEKARRHGKTFNWQTTMFRKIENYEDEDDCSSDFETEFPVTVLDNTLTTIPSEPTVCPPNDDEVDFRISLDESDDEDYTIWHHYQLLIRDTLSIDTRLRSTMRRLGIVTSRGSRRYGADREVEDGIFWRGAAGVREMSDTEIRLHTEQDMVEAGFGAYWDGSDRLIYDKGDLRDYWIEISSDRDFLVPAPSYVLIRDLVRRLCHRMIAYSISDRGQALENVTGVDLFYLYNMDHGTTNVLHLLAQYLFRHAEGRKSGARLSRGYFIGGLAMHFGLVRYEGLRELHVVTRELPLIDLHELGRLHICTRYGDTWAWVAQGPERQQAAATGAHEADEAGQVAAEIAQEIPALAQVAYGCPSRGVSDRGQAMLVPPQLLIRMLSPTLDLFLFMLLSFVDVLYITLITLAPLPTADHRHPWLRYQIKEYNEGIRHSYEQRLETIWNRPVN
ncbi:hypothetical protein Tco_0025930 [Tanacetum coccineum]